PRQLAVLARAGVVDAGGQGLVLLLEALLAVVTECSGRGLVVAAVPARPPHALQAVREGGSAEYEYEVMYLLEGTAEARVAVLRAELGALGDCVAVVGTGERADGLAALWNVHVHCSDIGAAIEAGVRAGRPHRITVIRFADQTSADQPGVDKQDRFVAHHGVLAMVSGTGVAELLRGEGALTVPVTIGVTELTEVLAGTRARHVTVLAGPDAGIRVAETAAAQARGTGQDVLVVPTASPVQALAAIAVHDVDRQVAEDIVAMTEAAAAARLGTLTMVRDELPACGGHGELGDVLGMVDGEVVLIERDMLVAGRKLVDRLLSMGGELVTVLLGLDASDGAGDLLAEYLRTTYPEVQVGVYQGGQPDSVLLVGVE
ncbi:MAG: DAK2 domain-containing protein, partial [Pseudonocardiaceae bacterium]